MPEQDDFVLPEFDVDPFEPSPSYGDLIDKMKADMKRRAAFREAAKVLIASDDEVAVGDVLYRLDVMKWMIAAALKRDMTAHGLRTHMETMLKELKEDIPRKRDL